MCLTFLYGGIQQPDQRGFHKEIDLLEWREVLKYKAKLMEGKGTAYFHIYVFGTYDYESQSKVIHV